MLSLTAFSQTATENKKVCFPDSVAKKIAIDLVKAYSNTFYDEPEKYTYDLYDLEYVYYKWLYEQK